MYTYQYLKIMKMEQKFINNILDLYKKYSKDLIAVRKKQYSYRYGDKETERILYRKYDDLESEILYMLVKEYKPLTIKELGCAGGWSLTWMLQACKEMVKVG